MHPPKHRARSFLNGGSVRTRKALLFLLEGCMQAGLPNTCQMSELYFGARFVWDSCRHCHELAAGAPALLLCGSLVVGGALWGRKTWGRSSC